MEKIEIVEYNPSLKKKFSEINYAWIQKYFVIEEMDRKMLDDPEEYILKKGGHILFIKYKNEIVGTCALIKKGEKIVELAKMGVDENFQGKGIGKKLIEAAIQKGKSTGIKTIFLVSNTILKPAIHLYKKWGSLKSHSMHALVNMSVATSKWN